MLPPPPFSCISYQKKRAGSTEVHKEASSVKLFEEQKNQQYLELCMTEQTLFFKMQM